ncbi:MAG: NADH-quinone oxidoreductase subunit J, partial [Planctomycetota bacterium]
MDQILFYVFAAQAVVAAVLSVTRKNTVAAACWLVVMFFGLAGVFVLEEAYFVATTQILVYAGAIMVLFLFVIMLMDLRSTELAAHKGPKLRFLGILFSLVFLGIVVYAIHDAGKRTDVVADRVSAFLHLPPPPPVASDDPTQPPTVLPAPPPQAIALARKETAWEGEFTADGKRGVLFVTPPGAASTSPAGWSVQVADEARAFPPVRTDAAGHAALGSGVPAGATVDVVVQHGGLAAYA